MPRTTSSPARSSRSAARKAAIFHLYNSTSPAQRRYVFNADQPAIVEIAAARRRAGQYRDSQPLIAAGTKLRLEYSPESFTSTELGFALEICEAVTDVWQPTAKNKIILNLPATVEYAMPNVHADQIEWMCTHLTRRDATVVSLHTHGDRGTGDRRDRTRVARRRGPRRGARSSATASAPAISTSSRWR